MSRNVITSLKEFITTLICLYLHSYFIMLRDCRRNETIYIHKKSFQCLLHQSSASLLQIEMLRDEFRVEIFLSLTLLLVLYLGHERHYESSLLLIIEFET